MAAQALDVLEAMLSRYRSCRSYRDTGEHTTVFIDGPKPWQRRTWIREFRTTWLRPAQLRFEFADRTIGPASEWQRKVLTWGVDGVRGWWSTRGSGTYPNIAHALAALAGVSGGISTTVPPMLCGAWSDAASMIARRLEEPVQIGTEDWRGALCHRLRGRNRSGEDVEVWIRADDYRLVRGAGHHHHEPGDTQRDLVGALARMRREGKPQDEIAKMEQILADAPKSGHSFDTECTTVWHGEFDVKLDARDLAFDPPA